MIIREGLASYIIESLSSQPLLSFALLEKQVLGLSKRSYTPQGIYKELRRLEGDGVVFKVKKEYGLSIAWMLKLMTFTERLSETYLEGSLDHVIPMTRKHKQIWHFTNLIKMNAFWSQLLLAVIHQSPSKKIFGYNPHPWFHLAHTKQESDFIEGLGVSGGMLYLIIGGTTFLDRRTERYWQNGAVEYHFGSSGFSTDQDVYINVIDEYVLTVRLSTKTSQEIEDIYTGTKAMKDLDISSMLTVFNQPTKVSIQLEHSPIKARRLIKKFSAFFGLS